MSNRLLRPGNPGLFPDVDLPAPAVPQRGPKKPPARLTGQGEVTNLSSAALRLREELQQRGRLTIVQAKAAVPQGAEAAMAELVLAGWALYCPGGNGTRAGRSAYWMPDVPCAPPTALELSFARGRLKGESGTLSRFQQLLGFDQRSALSVLRVLVEGGEASGGPVGATFAFRVYA